MIDSPENAFATRGVFKLCSDEARTLVQKAQSGGFADELDQNLAFYEFFCMSEGQQEFVNILKFIAGKPVQIDELAPNSVIHLAQLPQMADRKAVKLQNATGMAMANTAFARKEDRLQEAANNFL